MSTPDLLVLDSSDLELDADGNAAASLSLLDPVTGELTTDAFVIGSP